MMTSTGTVSTSWNGGVCGTCGARYLGPHTCSQNDILRRIQELSLLLAGAPKDRATGCPCRPENGGRGVCGCTLGGPQVTC